MIEPTRINLTTCDGATLHAMAWSDPLTDEQTYRVYRALGFRVLWAPWWKRAWWRVHLICRVIVSKF